VITGDDGWAYTKAEVEDAAYEAALQHYSQLYVPDVAEALARANFALWIAP
jgi:hypothetical protein